MRSLVESKLLSLKLLLQHELLLLLLLQSLRGLVVELAC